MEAVDPDRLVGEQLAYYRASCSLHPGTARCRSIGYLVY